MSFFHYAIVVLMSLAGCAYQELDQSTVHTVHINEAIEPAIVRAKVGAEIRWENRSDKIVRVGFLGTPDWQNVICDKGFRWMGMMQDSTIIKPNESVSLCFSKPTRIHFNVWMDWSNSSTNISPTSTILIEEN